MSFGDHLDELRRRILLALAVPLPLMLLIFFLNQVFDEILIRWLLLPVTDALRRNGLPQQLQVLSPTEMIVLQMKLSLIAALVLSAPWILYQAWKFIEPGLYAHEKRFVHFLLPFSAILTVAGIALMYFAMLPLMLRVLIGFGMLGTGGDSALPPEAAAVLKQRPVIRIVSEEEIATLRTSPGLTAGEALLTWPAMNLHVVAASPEGAPKLVDVPRSWIRQEFRLSEYINLVLMLMLAIAIAFQMPLVVTLLGWLGLASADWLRRQRRYALLICGLIAIIITPPDAISALIMLVPLYGLYELGILLLVVAPASAVAKGRVFSMSRFRETSSQAAAGRDNRGATSGQMRQSVQIEETVARQSPRPDPDAPIADRGEDRP